MATELKRFSKVLKVREVERDITQSELAMKVREEEGILEKIDQIEVQKRNAMDDFSNMAGRLMSPQELWFQRQNLDLIERHLGENKDELNQCRNVIEQTKIELLEKHRNVQLMERHVDRVREREDKARLLAEQNNLDDITTMRHLRRLRGGQAI